MAEQYICEGKLVNFTNGGALLLQELWIKHLLQLPESDKLNSIVNVLKTENSREYGARAYGIDDIRLDFDTNEPIKLLLKVNNLIIENFNSSNWISQTFGNEYPQDSLDFWKERLVKISNAIENEITLTLQ